MSNQAQYAAVPKIGVGVVSTGDTSRTAPTNFGTAFTAGVNGSRVDRINIAAIGTTIASMLRLFLVPGTVGVAISSIAFSGTTATVTTATPHGLANGATVTIQGALPAVYNVTNAAITVLTATTFTYTLSTTPTINAASNGYYVAIPAAPATSLWQEIPVSAVTPSSTVQTFSTDLSIVTQSSRLPLFLPPGWTLRASVNDTQTASGINVVSVGGDF